MNNYVELAKKYVQIGKEYLNEEIGSFKGNVTVMDTKEDTKDSEYRLILRKTY